MGKLAFENLTSQSKIDAYCVYCDRDSVFSHSLDSSLQRMINQHVPDIFAWWRQRSGIFEHHLSCTRNNCDYVIYFLKQGDILQKIGQHPSVADFQIPHAAKYRKMLGGEQYKEFTRGLGLAAHGVGIGSFVYLRRVFENLIEEAQTAAQQDADFDEDKYRNARMDEKIGMLTHHLPSFLVENKTIYGILSKGIHDLTEAECLDYFQPVRVGIELILDEKLEQAETKQKAQQAQAAIRKISQQIK